MARADKVSLANIDANYIVKCDAYRRALIACKGNMTKRKQTLEIRKTTVDTMLNLLIENRPADSAVREILTEKIRTERDRYLAENAHLVAINPTARVHLNQKLRAAVERRNAEELVVAANRHARELEATLTGKDGERNWYFEEVKFIPLTLGNGNAALRILPTAYAFASPARGILWANVWDTLKGEWYSGEVRIPLAIKGLTLNLDRRLMYMDGTKKAHPFIVTPTGNALAGICAGIKQTTHKHLADASRRGAGLYPANMPSTNYEQCALFSSRHQYTYAYQVLNYNSTTNELTADPHRYVAENPSSVPNEEYLASTVGAHGNLWVAQRECEITMIKAGVYSNNLLTIRMLRP
jgi:hypothetical protein